jgi:hypothetical protein
MRVEEVLGRMSYGVWRFRGALGSADNTIQRMHARSRGTYPYPSVLASQRSTIPLKVSGCSIMAA